MMENQKSFSPPEQILRILQCATWGEEPPLLELTGHFIAHNEGDWLRVTKILPAVPNPDQHTIIAQMAFFRPIRWSLEENK